MADGRAGGRRPGEGATISTEATVGARARGDDVGEDGDRPRPGAVADEAPPLGTGVDEGTAHGWRLILDTLRDQRLGIAVGVLVGLVWTASKVAVPTLVQQAIDEGIVPGDRAAIRTWALAIAGAAVIAAAFTGLRRYWAFRESRMVEARLRDRLFAHVQRLHFGFHDRVAAGELLSRGNTDLQQVQAFAVLIPLTISNAVTVLAVTVILLTIDPLLTVLALGALPMLNHLGRRFSTRLHPQVRAIQQESAQLAAVVEEAVGGVRVIKGFGAQDVQRRRLDAEAGDLYDAAMGASLVRSRYQPAMELLPNLALIAVLGVGGHQVLEGDLTLGELTAFNVYIVLLVWPLRMLGMIIAQSQRAAAAAVRVHEVLAAAPEIRDPKHPVALPPAGAGAADAGHVAFEGVTFGYAGGAGPVLDGLDLDLAPGESVALVGATGSGKSTVGRLLCRFYDVDAGAVRLDGVDVRDVRLAELRRAVALVFEETFLFSDTIAGNIAFARPDAPPEDIERAAPPGRGRRVRGRAGRRLRHRGRRARLLAVGWAAPAPGHRPGDPGRPPGADPR